LTFPEASARCRRVSSGIDKLLSFAEAHLQAER
jgi:hypothetical protein